MGINLISNRGEWVYVWYWILMLKWIACKNGKAVGGYVHVCCWGKK